MELSKLRDEGEASKYKSFLQAIRTAWSRDKVEEIKRRLDDMRAQLQFHVIMSHKGQSLQRLDDESRKIIESILKSNDDVVDAINERAEELGRNQKASEVAASQRHDEILGAISKYPNREVAPEKILEVLMAKLRFRQLDVRHDDIAEAHRTTFEWALGQDHSPQMSWPSLLDWLQNGSGVYWISGKAASGKSTLMKFLQDNPRLKEALKVWAGDRKLITLNFYFWNSGTELQRSQEGLFRSLLFQAIEQDPSLASTLFPEQYIYGAEWREFPSFHDLRNGFKKLKAQLDGSIKIFMLVDGLDEFDAARLTMSELAETFLQITQLPGCKALLSSRPLPAFESSFDTQPKLRLHDLTKQDIFTYVSEELRSHERFKQFSDHESTRGGAEQLVRDIVNSASGVFLWVKLVVRSLREGLQNYDTLSDLDVRLKSLPKDLEDLFRLMLRNIPPQYKMQSSRIFQIVEFHHYYLDCSGGSPLTALGLYAADAGPDLVVQIGLSPPPEPEVERITKEIQIRLGSRCCGLLELTKFERNEQGEEPGEQDEYEHEVHYLHKTVADFMKDPKVWANITDQTRGTTFDPWKSILQAKIMRIKTIRRQETTRTIYFVDEAMSIARLVEISTGAVIYELIQELENATSVLLGPWSLPLPLFPGRVGNCNFLGCAVAYGLNLYVRTLVSDSEKECIQNQGRPLLGYALYSNPDLAHILVEHGADPNLETVKFEFPNDSRLPFYRIHPNSIINFTTMLQLFVQYKVDPDAGMKGRVFVGRRVLEFFNFYASGILRKSTDDYWLSYWGYSMNWMHLEANISHPHSILPWPNNRDAVRASFEQKQQDLKDLMERLKQKEAEDQKQKNGNHSRHRSRIRDSGVVRLFKSIFERKSVPKS